MAFLSCQLCGGDPVYVGDDGERFGYRCPDCGGYRRWKRSEIAYYAYQHLLMLEVERQREEER